MNEIKEIDYQLPPGTIKIETITDFTKGKLIIPSTQKTKQPLAPKVKAHYIDNDTKISITITVKIDSILNVKSLDIYASEKIIGSHRRDIYVVYECKEETPNSLYPYTFTFEIPSSCHGHTVKTLYTYLHNDDPITSRGTETSVQNN